MDILDAKFCDFTEPAVTCFASATLAIAVGLLDHPGGATRSDMPPDRIVVIDEAHYPIGLIHSRQLFPFLGQAAYADQPIADLLEIDALPCVLHDQPLTHYAAELLYSSVRFWAVISSEGKYLGLVDTFYLRKFVALSATGAADEPLFKAPYGEMGAERPSLEVAKATAIAKSSELLWHYVKAESTPERAELPSDMLRLKQQLRLQIEQFRTQIRRSSLPSSGDPSITALRSLMQCLERLPLPLMLQTTAGNVVARNVHWQDQLGDLVDPGWVQREAAAVLEYAMPPPEPSLDRAPLESTVSHADPFEPPLAISSCQVGATPDTCICVCPLKNGQERIIQFIKIPLGGLFTESDVSMVGSAPSWLESPFRLATLDSTQEPSAHPPGKPMPEEDLWLVLAQDVTEQHQLTRELAAKNADLVHLNRLKDEFLACISHELRTPLTAVLGLSSLLKDQLSGSLNERQVRYAHLIHRSGRHLMTIVNDILDLTRMETGQLELAIEPVTIATVCDRAFEQAQQLYLEEQQEQQVTSDLVSQLPHFSCLLEPGLETLVADEQRLRQMLVHLLSNALKFTDATGRIGLNVGLWEGWVAFTVWDTGIGIPAEKQHLIFQKFQQLENPLTRRFEGAGLGLVLTQRLARLHGGDVSFTSKEHQGSQFTLLLPPLPPQPTLTLGGLTRPASENRLVLIVEAVVRSLENLGEQLGELGYRFVVARSGTEAVEKARRLQPCAVFLNPLLPALSGWDVLTLLKADAQTRGIPVIVMGTRSDRAHAYRNQADGFLSLPIAKKPLKQVLSQFTEAESAPDTADSETSLVVLRISPMRYSDRDRLGNDATIDLNALLHSQNYRVLEADDLEQAELLAQVWKPNVVVLDPAMPDPSGYLKLLGERSFLVSLPIVTLDVATTQAANQVSGLTVFPCLAPLVEQSVAAGQSETSALLQVIQVAAGFAWRPLVLAIDSAKIINSEAHHKESEWLQALMQYLQMAGFRGMVARSHSEAMQKLQTQSVDLLLVYWRETELDESSRDVLNALKNLPNKPPVLVIDHYSTPERNRSNLLEDEVFALLNSLSTQTLPPLPMEELLSQINQILTH
ncbi:ATP-binding protein [Myxacorys almedinensis]|uniref:histidine kinase n=1 Tax=Myxacorys almedinensis A TaxID=2690445 RepID=A0A8J7YZ45_9CYAN|nr:ATP-binding protein [Myxacorys almedinensis]NDJ17247.1 response regulator [Myxacorys almedinensis A]